MFGGRFQSPCCWALASYCCRTYCRVWQYALMNFPSVLSLPVSARPSSLLWFAATASPVYEDAVELLFIRAPGPLAAPAAWHLTAGQPARPGRRPSTAGNGSDGFHRQPYGGYAHSFAGRSVGGRNRYGRPLQC